MSKAGLYLTARWIGLSLALIAVGLSVALWLLSVGAIVEYRGFRNDFFLRGGRLFYVHYESKWKGHKSVMQTGERLAKETDDELVIERLVCTHCGNVPLEARVGQACEQCGNTISKQTERILWETPGGWKYSYLGFARAYPYFLISFDPRGMLRTHATGWNLNIPTGVFVLFLPLIVLVAIKLTPRSAKLLKQSATR